MRNPCALPPTTLPTGSTVVVIKKALRSFEQFSFFPICIKKKSIAKTFEHMYQFFLPLHPPSHPHPHRQFGSCTLCHKSKTQLKGERHKEMTPARKRLVLGRALAGRKSMGGNASIHGNGTMGGRGGSKDIYIFFSFFFFYGKMMHLFYPGREKAETRRERESVKKNTLLNIFWKKQVLWWGWVVWLRFVLSNCAEACVAVFQVSF